MYSVSAIHLYFPLSPGSRGLMVSVERIVDPSTLLVIVILPPVSVSGRWRKEVHELNKSS